MAQDLTKVIDDSQYHDIATAYANIRTHLTSASGYLYDACNVIVLSTEFEPTLDLLQTFYNVYITQRQTLLDNGPFLPAVRALNNHVLFRGTDTNGNPWASLNDYFGWTGILVPQNWITMSADAGFTISNVYAG